MSFFPTPGTQLVNAATPLYGRSVDYRPSSLRPMMLFAAFAAIATVVMLVFTPFASAQVMVGTTHADNITGTAGDDVIRGRGGDDTLQGNGGNDAIYGGSGSDHIQTGVSGAPGFVRCGDGVDFATVGVNVKVRKCEHVKRIDG